MEHFKPDWFTRFLSWLDAGIGITLASTLAVLTILFIFTLAEMRGTTAFVSSLLGAR